MFAHFTLCAPQVYFVLGSLLYIFPVHGLFLHCAIVTSASALICYFMLYNLIVGCTSFWVVFLYLPGAWVILPLHHRHICVCIHIFVNIISMFHAICWWSLYDLLLGCTQYWEDCHSYSLYMICDDIVTILFDLHAQ